MKDKKVFRMFNRWWKESRRERNAQGPGEGRVNGWFTFWEKAEWVGAAQSWAEELCRWMAQSRGPLHLKAGLLRGAGGLTLEA